MTIFIIKRLLYDKIIKKGRGLSLIRFFNNFKDKTII